jgi:hypothetical protein
MSKEDGFYRKQKSNAEYGGSSADIGRFNTLRSIGFQTNHTSQLIFKDKLSFIPDAVRNTEISLRRFKTSINGRTKLSTHSALSVGTGKALCTSMKALGSVEE